MKKYKIQSKQKDIFIFENLNEIIFDNLHTTFIRRNKKES